MDLRITEYNFKTLSPDQVKTLVADVQARSAERARDRPRPRAGVRERQPAAGPKNVEGIKADPPKIFWAPAPAILDQPRRRSDLEPDRGHRSPLRGQHQLGPVRAHAEQDLLPARQRVVAAGHRSDGAVDAGDGQAARRASRKLPADDNWKDVKAAVPGKKLSAQDVPKVFVSTDPAELIVLEGAASYLKVAGAHDAALGEQHREPTCSGWACNGDFYFLVAGRWFKAPSSTVRGRLPRRPCPTTSRRSRSSIRARACWRRCRARRRRPKRCCWRRIPADRARQQEGAEGARRDLPGRRRSSSRSRAPRTSSRRSTPTRTSSSSAISTTCASRACGSCRERRPARGRSPRRSRRRSTRFPRARRSHHVTYVTVEDDERRRVGDVRLRRGLYGPDDRLGLRRVGQRLVLPAVRRLRRLLPGYYPYPHTYGMGAWYNPYTGALRTRLRRRTARTAASGWARRYNPRTGTYARGAAAYGPYGSRAAGQAYNPRTGTYAQTRQGSNVYGNWGTSSVQRGDDWAQTAHRDELRAPARPRRGVRTSDGGGAVTRSGPAARTTVGRTSGGDVYAGRDGNVYRQNDGGGWEQNNGSGGWNPADGGHADRRATRRHRPGAQAVRGNGATTRRLRSDSQLERDSGARTTGNSAPRIAAAGRAAAGRARAPAVTAAVGRGAAAAAAPLGGLPRVRQTRSARPPRSSDRAGPGPRGEVAGHDAGPARLVAGAEPGAVVAVEILVEQDVVAPVRIVLELLGAAVDRPPAAARRAGRSASAGRRSPCATSNRFISLPEPVGHSILKLSP